MGATLHHLPGTRLEPELLLHQLLEDCRAGVLHKVVIAFEVDAEDGLWSKATWSNMKMHDLVYLSKVLERAIAREMDARMEEE